MKKFFKSLFDTNLKKYQSFDWLCFVFAVLCCSSFYVGIDLARPWYFFTSIICFLIFFIFDFYREKYFKLTYRYKSGQSPNRKMKKED